MQLLFDVYYDPLLLYCNRMVHDADGAEDIVQECFVHLCSPGDCKVLRGIWTGLCFRL